MSGPSTVSQFGRLQTGRNPRASRSPTVRCLHARQAGVGVGSTPLPVAGVDIAPDDLFFELARSLAGRSRAYAGVPTGAARLPATNSTWAAGRPVPQRVRPRATNAVEEQSAVARISLHRSRRDRATAAAAMMQPTTARFLTGAA